MSKKKELKAKHPEYVFDIIEILAENDPSKTNKYLPFMIKSIKSWVDATKTEFVEQTFKQLFEVINDFHELSEKNLIDNKDIYSYKENEDILKTVKEAKEKITTSQIKKEQTIHLYEDDTYKLVIPLTSDSSNLYGRSTKWCVSSTDNDYKHYFGNYTRNGVLVFVINKTYNENQCRQNKTSRVAFHMDKDTNKMTAWDCQDAEMSMFETFNYMNTLPKEAIDLINTTLNGKSVGELAKAKGLV